MAESTIDPSTSRSRTKRRAGLAAALVAAALAGAGATAMAQRRHAVTLVALAPAPISTLADGTNAAVKGSVLDIFGGRFVVQDDSGRALIDLGPAAGGAASVGKGETVTVQGRFERGALRAAAVTHADGHVETFDAPPPRRGGPDRRPPVP